MLDIFEEAAHFTMDNSLRDILLNSSMGIFPKQFSVKDGMIITNNDEHIIPKDPMDLTNLIHDIMSSKMKKKTIVTPQTSTRSRDNGMSMDELYMFSMREASRIGKTEDHGMKIWGLIYSCVYLGITTAADIKYKNSNITSIDRIDVEIPQYIERE